MKKIVTIAAVALFATLVLPSCKKDYKCTCTLLGQSQTTEIKDAKKKDAKSACDQLNTAAATVGGNCTLD